MAGQRVVYVGGGEIAHHTLVSTANNCSLRLSPPESIDTLYHIIIRGHRGVRHVQTNGFDMVNARVLTNPPHLSFHRGRGNSNCFSNLIASWGASAMEAPELDSTHSFTKSNTFCASLRNVIPIWSYFPNTTVSPASIVPESTAWTPLKMLMNVD